MINTILANRYTILEKIGGGGMADVYRAHDKLLDRSVAVKVLKSQFTDDEQFITSFRQEAQAAAKLAHPNIVNIYDVGHAAADNTYYIIMEYICGETLKNKIEREAPLPLETVVRIATEIGEALEHAHQNNIVHCDVKPHNILMTRSGRIKVTDFGIARAVTSSTMTQSGTIIGSVHYFSPEQARGHSISAKSDIYSLGVVLYEMLTGVLPFTGENSISIALKHLQEEPRPLTELNPDIPPLIEAVVLKAMAKNPDNRYTDIGEMLADFALAQNFLRDDHTRRLANTDFPTQILPQMNLPPMREGKNSYHKAADKIAAAKPTAKSQVKLILLLLFLLFGSAVAAFLGFGKFWSLSEVVVPNVVGKQIDTARNILLSHNLRVSLSEAYSDKVPAGYVISQQPEPDATVKEQRMITLVVSKGGEIATIPDLRGLTRRDAELQLKNLGLKLGRVDEQFAQDMAPDTVISQNPRPPAQVAKGTSVDFVVSKGPSPKKITVPDFQGSALNNVNNQLDSLKLKLGKVTEAASDKVAAGIIISQNPAPSSDVEEGSSIDFTVAKSGVAKRSIPVQVTVPENSAKQVNIQIVVSDANGSRTVYDGTNKPGDKIEKNVEVTGQTRVQVLLNNALLREQSY